MKNTDKFESQQEFYGFLRGLGYYHKFAHDLSWEWETATRSEFTGTEVSE